MYSEINIRLIAYTVRGRDLRDNDTFEDLCVMVDPGWSPEERDTEAKAQIKGKYECLGYQITEVQSKGMVDAPVNLAGLYFQYNPQKEG